MSHLIKSNNQNNASLVAGMGGYAEVVVFGGAFFFVITNYSIALFVASN